MSTGAAAMVPEPEAIAILEAYGIPYPDHGVAHNPDEAVAIAERIGYPVVLKISSPDVLHKSDAGGVAVGLENAAAVRQAYDRIVQAVGVAHPGARTEDMLVCCQAPAGLEVIAGAMRDAMFGPTLMFGLGGIFAEVLRDVTFRVLPIEAADAEEMVREVRGYPLLAGVRGQAAYDVGALVDLLVSLSRLFLDHPGIEELDLNPVRLCDAGPMALDARIIARDWGERS
jgi:acyl-CoA synthetase (NDP forming)